MTEADTMQDGEPQAVATALPFASLTELRREHLSLMKSLSVSSNRTELTQAIAYFIRRAEVTGANIGELADRDAAMGILDYWMATLSGMGGHPSIPGRISQLVPFDAANAPDLKDRKSPFMGLSAFGETDASQFFGRENAVKTLLDKVAANHIVIVAGASGSGKSSLVLAGLLPRLKAGLIPGSKEWCYFPVIVPGTDPLAALAQTVCPQKQDVAAFVAEIRPRLQRQPALFANLVADIASSRGGEPGFFVVDQFEELFTLCRDQPSRDAFTTAILSAAGGGKGASRFVLTLRDDFLEEARHLPDFGRWFSDPEAIFSPPALSAPELRRVIEEPTQAIGLKISESVTTDLVKEVLGEPTALPMLQFTLQKLWHNRDRNRITWEVYQQVGRPAEALKRTAEKIFAGLTILESQELARRIFLDLVQPAGSYEFVRRRVRRQTLAQLGAPGEVNRILGLFVDEGLIRVTPAAEADDDRFEVAHEALIRNWPRLGDWLAVKRSNSERELRLASTAQLWRTSGKQQGYLLTGEALAEAMPYAKASPDLEEFIGTSTARTKSRRAWTYGVIGALTFLTIMVLGGLTLYQREKNAQLTAINDELSKAQLQLQNDKDAATRALNDAQTRSLQEANGKKVLLQAFSDLVKDGTIPKDKIPKAVRDICPDCDLTGPPQTVSYQPVAFDAQFLGTPVPMPKLPAGLQASEKIDFYHYSLILDESRRMALVTASNYDRDSKASDGGASRAAAVLPSVSDRWQLDDLLFTRAADQGFDLIRVPLVGRNEIAWGDDKDAGAKAGVAANFYPNIVPQSSIFTQSVWTDLQAWLLVSHNPGASRVTYFSGPVLASDDRFVAGIQIPGRFWKIAVSREPKSGVLVVDAFLVDQSDMLKTAHAAPPASNGPEAYRTTVANIEELTGLDFGELRKSDRFALANEAADTTVLFQFEGVERDKAQALADAFNGKGFSLPGIEQRKFSSTLSEVRYFNLSDQAPAQRFASKVRSLLYLYGYGLRDVAARDFTGFTGKKQDPGVIELWLGLSEPSNPPNAQWKDAPWMPIAAAEIGTGEQAVGDNPRIREYLATVTDSSASEESLPWSSAFLEWVMEKARLTGTKSASNRSWQGWGEAVDPPVPGCVASFRRTTGPSTVVGFYLGKVDTNVLILGGNFFNMVSVTSVPQALFIGCRLPATTNP